MFLLVAWGFFWLVGYWFVGVGGWFGDWGFFVDLLWGFFLFGWFSWFVVSWGFLDQVGMCLINSSNYISSLENFSFLNVYCDFVETQITLLKVTWVI